MKRRGLWAACVILLVGVGVLAVGAGFAKDEDAAGAKCSEATLRGTYLFGTEGFGIEGNDKIPFAAAGYEVYNGNVNSVFSFSVNGKITRHEHASGTYTVKADCTGTVTYPGGNHYDQFIAPDGSMFTFVQTDPGALNAGFELRGTAKRVAQ